MMFESFTASAERALKRADRLAKTSRCDRSSSRSTCWPRWPPSRRAALRSCWSSSASRWTGSGPSSSPEIARILGGIRGRPRLEAERPGHGGFAEPLPVSPALRLVLNEATMQARGLGPQARSGHRASARGPARRPPVRPPSCCGRRALSSQTLRERLTEAVAGRCRPAAPGRRNPPARSERARRRRRPGTNSRRLGQSAREGLRVVEDYVRFVLDDPGLTRRLKEVRHRLAEAERGLDAHLLLGSRDTREDVGTHIMTPSEQIRENPRAVLAANFKRIAEALRSLEEYSKLVDVWLAGRFEVLRYDVYTLEKLTMTAVAAHRGLGDARLMVLVGGLPTLGDLTWVVGEALAGGADVIQYREKGLPDRELLAASREVRILTAQARVPLIVNDRVDLARLASCDGVHLGQEDLSLRDARRIMGPAALIGVSTHDREQLDAAILAGASYLGVGPVFPSPTKDFSEPELAGSGLRPPCRRDHVAALVRHRRDQRREPRPRARSGRHADRREQRGRPCRQPSPCRLRGSKTRLEGNDTSRGTRERA